MMVNLPPLPRPGDRWALFLDVDGTLVAIAPTGEEVQLAQVVTPPPAEPEVAVAVAEQEGEVRSLGVIPNREDSVRKLVRKLNSTIPGVLLPTSDSHIDIARVDFHAVTNTAHSFGCN